MNSKDSFKLDKSVVKLGIYHDLLLKDQRFLGFEFEGCCCSFPSFSFAKKRLPGMDVLQSVRTMRREIP